LSWRGRDFSGPPGPFGLGRSVIIQLHNCTCWKKTHYLTY